MDKYSKDECLIISDTFVSFQICFFSQLYSGHLWLFLQWPFFKRLVTEPGKELGKFTMVSQPIDMG